MGYSVASPVSLDNSGSFNQLKQCLTSDPIPASAEVEETIQPVLIGGLRQQTTQDQVLCATAIPFSDGTNRIGIATVSAVREEGTLLSQNSSASTPTPPYTKLYTVPVGKKWILKYVNVETGTVVGGSALSFSIIPAGVNPDANNAANVEVRQYKTASPASGTLTVQTFTPNVTLTAGSSVKIYFNGTSIDLITTEILYQEFNA